MTRAQGEIYPQCGMLKEERWNLMMQECGGRLGSAASSIPGRCAERCKQRHVTDQSLSAAESTGC